MDRFNQDGGFIARQLTDNAYISRVTKRYLGHVCDANKIATVPGGLTAMMRGKWQLNRGDHNRKERNDHRHHIIDAFVVGLTDRGVLNQVSRNSARGADDRVHIELPDVTPLRNQLSDRLDTIIVSYKPDHGANGKMFKETAYGLVADKKQDPDLPGYGLVTRKKIDSLSLKEINTIRNPGWRTRVQAQVEIASAAKGRKPNKNELANILAKFGKENNIKTMRILVSNQSAISIPSAPWKAYAPDSFMCVDIWQIPKGNRGNWKTDEFEWHGAFWSYAECKGETPDKNKGLINGAPIHPAAKHISRLFKNDLVELVEDGQSKIMKVGGFSTTNNKIDLRPQYETDGERKFLSINVLSKSFRKKIWVSEDGRPRS
jgi:CRISPR-associated endonuclease Csn1